LFLPPDYRYGDFGGTMTRETAATAESAIFSRIDYSQKEFASKAELAKELKSELASAQKKLSSGNVKEAMADYNRARAKGNFTGHPGNNLINAQNAFSFNNAAQAGVQPQPAYAAGQSLQVQYDSSAAEAQWAKLQQAQELGIAKIQPIRINLPTRGLRHAFTQVLQTETGKPMTIRLFATNDKLVSWPKRALAGIGGFLVLWLILATFTRRSVRPS
jgi:hypothetical protein